MPGGPRVAPSTAPDQATRLLLSHMTFMERLDNDDFDTLAHQPAPHGPFFAWIESQFQEHGPQPWAVLKDRIAATEHGHFALQLMTGPHGHPEGDEQELFQELRNILGPMMAERIGHLATEALKSYMANPSDTAAKSRYQALIERRNRLLAAPTSSGN